MILVIIQIICLFIIPVILIITGIIKFKNKLVMLYIVTLLTLLIAIIEKWSLTQYGINFKFSLKELIYYCLLTLVFELFILIYVKIHKSKPIINWKNDTHFIYGFILVSVCQEFIFRSFLILKLEELTSNFHIIITINALLFTFMHIIYKVKLFQLLILFISGLFFALIYYYFPNLILISIVHSILNFTIVRFGYLSTERLINIKNVSRGTFL